MGENILFIFFLASAAGVAMGVVGVILLRDDHDGVGIFFVLLLAFAIIATSAAAFEAGKLNGAC